MLQTGSDQVRDGLSLEELRSIYARIAKRYDYQHALSTGRSDQRGRKLVVEKTVREGDSVLDCGSGTGTTGLMAARKVGPNGKVILFELSEEMQAVARQKVNEAGLQDRVEFQTGDIMHLPFASDQFDVVLSTYSVCPLYDPRQGVMELYRVTRPGGRLAVAHSAEPEKPMIKRLANGVENLLWHLPSLSMGCRPVAVLPALESVGAKVLFSKRIGVPLWPFLVFVVEKPAA